MLNKTNVTYIGLLHRNWYYITLGISGRKLSFILSQRWLYILWGILQVLVLPKLAAVYPIKCTIEFTLLWFVLVISPLLVSFIKSHLSIFFRVASQVPKSTYDCLSAGESTLKDMGRLDRDENKQKQNAVQTVCRFLLSYGIYCTFQQRKVKL